MLLQDSSMWADGDSDDDDSSPSGDTLIFFDLVVIDMIDWINACD